ncbi:MAG: nitroreductase [Planctomycetota bacterium]|nr:MAG: nitroreductase [Planctomycetota bacterium]
MERPAPADHPLHELILRRWSPRAFDPRPVEHAKLLQVFEAARWAASSFNEQPWSFVYATRADGEPYQRLFDCLVPGNQKWAGLAPVLCLSVARLTFARTGKRNRHAWHDVGLACANLWLQAIALGLAAHFMAGFDAEKAAAAAGVPEGQEPVAMFVLGYPGDPGTLPEDLREREVAPRVRRPIAQSVFRGTCGVSI